MICLAMVFPKLHHEKSTFISELFANVSEELLTTIVRMPFEIESELTYTFRDTTKTERLSDL